MNNFKLGLVSVSFREHSTDELVKAVSDAGLDCIEWGSDVHAPYNDPDALAHIVKLQKEYGITCSSYGTYFRFQKTDISELPAYIAAAKALGTNILRLWCGVKGSESYNEDEVGKKELFDLCRKAADIAEKENVYLCMECHSRTYTDSPESTVELMKAINSSHFCMFWQPNQNRDVDYNIDFARTIEPYTKNLHVFHWEGSNKFPLSKGASDWQKYIGIFNDNRALLLEFLYDDKLSSLSSEAATLKEIANGKK